MEKFQAVRKSGKLWREETILAQVWYILPDNSDPSSDLLVRAPVLQLAALMWIQIELFCYSQTSCYHLFFLSPLLQSWASSLWNFLLSLEEQSEKLHDSIILRKDILNL